MKLYHSIERKTQPTVIEEIIGEGGSEAAIVLAAPYFAKENYTKLDKFSYFRNENADINPVGSLSVMPSATSDANYLAITDNADATTTALKDASEFFAKKITATNRTMPTSGTWSCVEFGTIFVAAMRHTTSAASSTDGVTWTARSVNAIEWNNIKFGNSIYVLIGRANSSSATNIYNTSADGLTWTSRTLPVSGYWNNLVFGNGMFVLAGSTGLYTSTNGTTWTQRSALNFSRVAAGGGYFVAFSGSTCYTSTNGTSWTQRETLTGSVGSCVWGNGVFIGQINSDIISSIDGVTWGRYINALPIVPNVSFGSFYFGNGVFVAVGFISGSTTNAIAISRNGIAWTQHTLSQSAVWYGSAFGSAKFVVVGHSASCVNITESTTVRVAETPTTLTLPANHSYFVKIT
jgi:hypothetical protein